MSDVHEELKKAKYEVEKLVKSIENKTIYEVNLAPHIKRNLLMYMDENSVYSLSFRNYLDKIADKIAKNLSKRDSIKGPFSEQRVMFEHILIQDENLFTNMGLIGSDNKEITKLVNEKLNESNNI